MLDRLDLLAAADEPVTPHVRLAAWFHDAVHHGATPADEQASAALAAELLGPALGADGAREVARLVLLTAAHDPAADDTAGRLLCDADLGVLGGTAEDYCTYTEEVRAEYAHVPEPDFRSGRTVVLRRLLDRPHLFRTPTGRRLWEAAARRNLSAEVAALEQGT